MAHLWVRSFTVLALHTATGVVSVAGSSGRALHACGSVGRGFPSSRAQLALTFVLIWDQPVINLALLTQSCVVCRTNTTGSARHTCGPTLIGLLSISTERAAALICVWHLVADLHSVLACWCLSACRAQAAAFCGRCGAGVDRVSQDF